MGSQLVTDELWDLVRPMLPPPPPPKRADRPGRHRIDDRVCLAGILLVLRSGMPWELMPREMGCSGMTCWRRLRDWQAAGVWQSLHRVLLDVLNWAGEIDWSRAVLDSATVRAVGAGEKNRPQPRRPAKARLEDAPGHRRPGFAFDRASQRRQHKRRDPA